MPPSRQPCGHGHQYDHDGRCCRCQILAESKSSVHILQGDVGQWHRSVFGEHNPFDHIRAIAQKAEEEAKELDGSIKEAWLSSAPIAREIADVMICALVAADRLGIDLSAAVRAKLEILKHPDRNQLERDRERGIVQAEELSK